MSAFDSHYAVIRHGGRYGLYCRDIGAVIVYGSKARIEARKRELDRLETRAGYRDFKISDC